METKELEPSGQPAVEPAGGGCLSNLGWYAASFVLPLGSLSFYRRASRRTTGSAVLFFVLFMAIVTLVAKTLVEWREERVVAAAVRSAESSDARTALRPCSSASVPLAAAS